MRRTINLKNANSTFNAFKSIEIQVWLIPLWWLPRHQILPIRAWFCWLNWQLSALNGGISVTNSSIHLIVVFEVVCWNEIPHLKSEKGSSIVSHWVKKTKLRLVERKISVDNLVIHRWVQKMKRLSARNAYAKMFPSACEWNHMRKRDTKQSTIIYFSAIHF